MKKTYTFVLLTFLLGLFSCSSGNSDAKKAALLSATSWLELVDMGEYPKSWDESASYFKYAVSKETWVNQVRSVRVPLGKVNSRSFKASNYYTSLPGAPDGEYVVIQYKTSFENKKSSTETITPMLDSDGNWRVSGYYIK